MKLASRIYFFTALAATTLSLFATTASAAICTFNQVSGAWTSPANWTACAGGNGAPAGTPGTADSAVIGAGQTATLPVGNFLVGDVVLANSTIQGAGLGATTLNVVAAGGAVWGAGTHTFQNMTVVFTSMSTINAASGPLTVDNSLMILTAPLTTLLADSITITGPGAKIRNNGIFNPSTFLNMTAGGEFENDASFTPVSPLTISGTFINQGAFLTTAGVPVTLTNAAAFSQPVAAGFLGGNGTIVATGQTLTVASGFIEGNIIIAAGLLNNTGAVVSPGGVGISGSIQIVGDYAASAAAGLDIEIAGGSIGPVIDRLLVSGTATFTSAMVNFYYIDTGFGVYAPSPGDSQNFVDASVARVGFFGSFTHPPGPNTISLNYAPPGIVQFVVTAPSAVTLNANPIVLAPTPINWTRALFVTASNSSASPVTFSPPTIAGAPGFSVSVNQVPGCITGTIPALGSCDFIFNFTPTALGSVTSTFTLLTSGGNFSMPVSSTGIATIAFPTVAPALTTFPPTAVGALSAPQPVVFSSPAGGSTLQFQVLPITGTDAADFAIVTDLCDLQFVAAGASCTVRPKFAPLATTGAKSATLTYFAVEPLGAFRQISAGLAGTAVVAAPAITVTGTTTFPTTAIGSSSTVQFITINNSGSANLNLASITNSNVAVFKDTVNGPPPQAAQYCGFGSDAAGAPLTGGPIVIAPGAICNLAMVFAPNAAGALSATITVTSNAPTSPTIITLTGTGAAAPTATLTPGPLNFGSVTVGSTSAPLTATFANPSATALQLSTISVGPGFNVTGGTCVVGNIIAAGGGNCTITATATPIVVGALSSALQVFTSPLSNNPSVVVTVNGTAAAVPPVITSATTASGSVGTPLSYQIVATNSPTLYGINSLPAGVSINTATGLISGTPTAAGVGTVTITATNASGTGTQLLTFTILAAASPAVTLTPPSVAFGTRAVATTSPPGTVTLGNSGTALLTIASITSIGNFGFTTSCPISPATLAIGIACPINIIFTPLTATLLTGAITIASNAPGSPHTITLSGTGSGVAVPGISLVPASLAFGAQTVNTISALQSVVVSNTGFANLNLTSITVGAPFSRVPLGAVVPPDCGASLAPSSSCQIAVNVSPTAAGSLTGLVSIADNATGSPHTVTLSATGTPVPVPVISTSGALAFGDQVINSVSGVRAITISNTGSATLTISAITLTGTNAVNFAMTGQSACTSILPSSSCTLILTFAPTATGAKTAQINITSNTQIVAAATASTPTLVSLTGNGVLAPRPIVTVTSTAIGFGDVIFGGATPYQTVTLTNAGGQAMSITSIVAIGDFVPVNTCPTSLASLASCTISIIFTPLLQGNRSGEIAITTSATTSPDRVQLSGRGCRWFSPAQSRFFLTSCG